MGRTAASIPIATTAALRHRKTYASGEASRRSHDIRAPGSYFRVAKTGLNGPQKTMVHPTVSRKRGCYLESRGSESIQLRLKMRPKKPFFLAGGWDASGSPGCPGWVEEAV